MTEETRGEEHQERWKYTICLVGFPEVFGVSEVSRTTFEVSEMIDHLIPEACVRSYRIFGTEPEARSHDTEAEVAQSLAPRRRLCEAVDVINLTSLGGEATTQKPDEGDNHASAGMFKQAEDDLDDTASVASTVLDPFWSVSIEKEAVALLESVRRFTSRDDNACRRKLLLAGYGFGGFVVKQAIVLANTTPKYYDIAYNVSKLVFFSTPHRADIKRGWEGVLLDMIKAQEARFSGRLSQILSTLVTSVSQISHVFYELVAKYPIVNFIEGRGISTDEPVIGELGKFDNDSEGVVQWQQKNFETIRFCDVDTHQDLESLRIHFAPVQLLNNDISCHFGQETQAEIKDTYFEALQILSKSHWILHETRSLERGEDFIILKNIYSSLLKDASLSCFHNTGSIQVIGPPEYGKSLLLKLIVQEIRQKSPVIVLDSYLALEEKAPSVYGLLASYLHQIISQRPSIFYAIRNMVADILLRDPWTEKSVYVLFEALLYHCEQVEILAVIYDYDDWPGEIRSWWSGELQVLLRSCGTEFTFITSSRCRIENLAAGEPHEIDLEKNHEMYRRKFERAKLDSLLDRSYSSIVFEHRPTADLRNKIKSEARHFQGSFTAISNYLALAFQRAPLTTVEAIEGHIEASPKTEQELYKLEISALREKRIDVRFWIASAISWMMWSARPLRLEELAAATAVKSDDSTLEDIQDNVSMDMEQDLKRHLAPIVSVEHRRGRVTSGVVRDLLAADAKNLDLQDDYRLTRLCLHYLKVVLTGLRYETDNATPNVKGAQADGVADEEKADDDEGIRPESERPGSGLKTTWEECLSHVSWKHWGHSYRRPALEFLDYACRFWPKHFLRISNPDKSLKDEVISFLQAPHGQHWFQLYLVCHGQSTNPLGTDDEDKITTATLTDHESIETVRKNFTENSNQSTCLSTDRLGARRQTALRMACYVGLTPIVLALLGSTAYAADFEVINVRRGCSERAVVILDTLSSYYLSCATANDDADLTMKLLELGGPEVAKLCPLHQAALGGSLKTSMVLFQRLQSPADSNEDGRTPLHMAAAGGHTDIILLLLGKDAFEHEPRHTEALNTLNEKDHKGQTPLIIAASMGHVGATKLLLQCDADVFIQDDTGKTVLHYAVFLYPAVVKDLLFPELIQVCDNDSCTALHIAARSGNAGAVSAIMATLQKGHPLELVNSKNEAGKTPLQYAAESGYEVIVEELLRYQGYVEEENYKSAAVLAAARGHLTAVRPLMSKLTEHVRCQLLVEASAVGQLLIVQYLLREVHISPQVEWEGRRPLCEASARGHMEVVHALLRSKASVSAVDGERKTPLHHAAEHGMYWVARALLSRQANVNAPDVDRETPLHCASGKGNVSVVKLFIDTEHKANIEACSRTGETPLHLAVEYSEVVKILLGSKADPNVKDSLRQTPLHLAARCKCTESVRHLLDHGADALALDDNGWPPLYYAITQDDLPTAQELSKKHTDLSNTLTEKLSWAIDSTASNVFRFLHGLPRETKDDTENIEAKLLCDAAAAGSVEVLDIILQSGVDVNSKWQDWNALHYAAANGRAENVRKLLGCGVELQLAVDDGRTALHLAADANDAEVVKLLLDADFDINIKDDDFRTPLYVAAYDARVESLKVLLEYKPDLSIANIDGWTPLHVAADSLPATELLVGAGASPNVPKSDRWTPLHLAIAWEQYPVVEFLLQHKGDPTLITEDGDTGLHVAVRTHSVEMVTIILKQDVSKCINERGLDESTPLRLALECSKCDVGMVQLLIKHGANVELRTNEEPSALILAVNVADLEKIKFLLNMSADERGDFKWQLDDLIQAYWTAVALFCEDVASGFDVTDSEYPNIVKALVEEELTLRETESAEEGLNALETCLSKGGEYCQEESFAIQLVDLGINPLCHRRSDRKSALEFGILSRRLVKTKFLSHCVDYIPTNTTDAAALGLGFLELRIATELEQDDMWRKLEPLRNNVGSVSDADGWDLDHFVHQSAGRIDAPVRVLSTSFLTPQGLVRPPQWVHDGLELGERLKIEDDRQTVIFSPNLRYCEDIVCLRADFPFPPRPTSIQDDHIRYFEVKILSSEAGLEEDVGDSEQHHPPTIAVGFCGEFADMTDAHVGWSVWTVGYHGDNGMIFEYQDPDPQYDTEHPFGPGSTVGCGIDYSEGEYFFTLDGEEVARRKDRVIFRKLYPAISQRRGPCKAQVTFDQSKCVWQRPVKQLTRTPTGSRRGSKAEATKTQAK